MKTNRIAGVMPMHEVARRLGIHEKTAWNNWSSALRKLKAEGSFEDLIDIVRAGGDYHPPLQGQSVECLAARGEF